MWIIVFFDLPVTTKENRDAANKFRRDLIKGGFTMFQFSVYIRHCMSREKMDVHIKRVKQLVPEHGAIGILAITDKQFSDIVLFYGAKTTPTPPPAPQLTMF